MALPGVTINVLDGNLSLQPGSTSRVMLFLGVCTLGTPNTLYTIADGQTLSSTLGLGKLVEQGVYDLGVASGPAQFMPLNPSLQGGVGAVSHVGTGAGTVAVSTAPHQSITIQCTTAGALGVAAFTFQLGSGPVSAPVVSAASWSSTGFLVPGTYCVVVFTAGNYVAGGTPDIYTISVLGVIAHPQGAGPAVPTITASPVDDYTPLVTIVTGGAIGTAQFTYSLDGTAASASANTLTPGGAGAYSIPNTGLVLTFAGTFVALDTYSFKTASITYASADLAAALTALEGTFLAQSLYSMATVVDGNATSAAWATQAGTLETAALTLFNNGIYARFFNQCPTVGSISPNGSGGVTVDSADTDNTVAASAATLNDPHVVGCAGDLVLTSPVTGLALRRNCAWVASGRAAAIEASRNIGDVGLGGVPGVVSLFRDENATPSLDAARFVTMRTFPGSVAAGTGVPGFFLTDGHTMAASTSDYSRLTNARVVDRGCTIARVNTLPLVNSKVPTFTRNGLPGVITEKKAQQIEGRINGVLATGLVDSSPQDAVAAACTVNRTHNILSDGNLILTVAIQPFAYARTITVNIGMVVSAGGH